MLEVKGEALDEALPLMGLADLDPVGWSEQPTGKNETQGFISRGMRSSYAHCHRFKRQPRQARHRQPVMAGYEYTIHVCISPALPHGMAVVRGGSKDPVILCRGPL